MSAAGLLGDSARWPGQSTPPPATMQSPSHLGPDDALRRHQGPVRGPTADVILDMCDGVLGEASKRDHPLDWLASDGHEGVVDAYYPACRLIVICESAPPPRAAHRSELIAAHGMRLLEIDLGEFRQDPGRAFSSLVGRVRAARDAKPPPPKAIASEIRWVAAANPARAGALPAPAAAPVFPSAPAAAPPALFPSPASAPLSPSAPAPPALAPPLSQPAPPPQPAPGARPLPGVQPASLSLPPLPQALQAYLKPPPAAAPIQAPAAPRAPTSPPAPPAPTWAPSPRAPAPPPAPPAAVAPPLPPPPSVPPPSALPSQPYQPRELTPLELARLSTPSVPVIGSFGIQARTARPAMGERQAAAAARASRNIRAKVERRLRAGQPAGAGLWGQPSAATTLASMVAPRQPDPRVLGSSNKHAQAVERALVRARTMPARRRTPHRSWNGTGVAPPDYAARAPAKRPRPSRTPLLAHPAPPAAAPPPAPAPRAPVAPVFPQNPPPAPAPRAPVPAPAAPRPAAAGSDEMLGIGLVAACIAVLELIGALAIIAGGGPAVLGFGLALDAGARALGTMAAAQVKQDWSAGWPWACALAGSPAVALFAFNSDGSFTEAELAAVAGPLAIAAILALVIGLAGLPLGI